MGVGRDNVRDGWVVVVVVVVVFLWRVINCGAVILRLLLACLSCIPGMAARDLSTGGSGS